MALTDQPYLPLYVNDWMNNNKLKYCSARAHGLMISIMCIMHKESEYGKFLLKQRYQHLENQSSEQRVKQVSNFASQLDKQLPFDLLEIFQGLQELLDEKVLEIEGDYLVCRRMVKDSNISTKRALSGGKGGKKTQEKIHKNKEEKFKDFALAKKKANTEIEYVYENEDKEGDKNIGGVGEKEKEEGDFWNTHPTSETKLDLPEEKIILARMNVRSSQAADITEQDVLDKWEIFKGNNFTGEKWYQSPGKVFSHFINWVKDQKFKNENTARFSSNGTTGSKFIGEAGFGKI